MTEAQLLAQVEALADQHNVIFMHNPDSRRTHGLRGFPDVVLCGSEFACAELKAIGGTLTQGQVEWKYRIISSGVAWYLWTPREYESGEIERVMSALAPHPSRVPA
jgi:hypothetical protein